jgi:hypothetical protein
MIAAYDQDFHAWLQQQAALLKTGRLHELDVAHLVEEIESMGASERRELLSRLQVLILHLFSTHKVKTTGFSRSALAPIF